MEKNVPLRKTNEMVLKGRGIWSAGTRKKGKGGNSSKISLIKDGAQTRGEGRRVSRFLTCRKKIGA